MYTFTALARTVVDAYRKPLAFHCRHKNKRLSMMSVLYWSTSCTLSVRQTQIMARRMEFLMVGDL